MSKTMTTNERMVYSLGDVIANGVLQIIMVVLLKLLADHLGLIVAVVIAVAYVAVQLLVHFCNSPYFSKSKPIDTRQEMLTSFGNMPWRVVALTMMLVSMGQSLRCVSVGFYFFDYVDVQSLSAWLSQWSVITTHDDVRAVGLTVYMAVAVMAHLAGGMFFSQHLSYQFGKKETCVGCLMLSIVFSLALYLPQPDDITLMFVLCVLKSLAFAPVFPLLWALTGDVADHVEQQYGRRATGFCFSGVMFALKTGLGLGAIAGGLLLIGIGYMPESSGMESWTVMQGVRLANTVFPALIFIAGVSLLWAYPITKYYREQIQAELAERRRQS